MKTFINPQGTEALISLSSIELLRLIVSLRGKICSLNSEFGSLSDKFDIAYNREKYNEYLSLANALEKLYNELS